MQLTLDARSQPPSPMFDNTRTKASILRRWYMDRPKNVEYETLCNRAKNETERRSLIDRYNRGEIGCIGCHNEDGSFHVTAILNPDEMRQQTIYNRINKIDQILGKSYKSPGNLLDIPAHREWIKRLYAYNVMHLSSEDYKTNPSLVEMPPPFV